MNEPRIKLGVDDRFLVFVFALLFIGCVADVAAPKKPPPKPNTLEQIAFESFQRRDAIRGERLLKLADDIEAGVVKYDGKVMDAWAEIGKKASEETWKTTAEAAAKMLDGGNYDAKKTADATRMVGRASLKAGGK